MCHHKANISATAFAQLQLFNKPFPICKCSNHSCIAVLEAISGCLKCRTEVHLEKLKITLQFSWNLPVKQCLHLLLPFPACPFQQQSPHPALLPSCPLAQNIARLVLGALCLSAAQGSCDHQVVRNPNPVSSPMCSLLLQGCRWHVGLLWLCASRYVSMSSVLHCEHQLPTPAMGNTPVFETHTHIHFIVLCFFNF